MVIGFIGGGNMGEAIIAGIHSAYEVCVCEKDKKKAASLKRKYGVKVCDLECAAKSCDVIVLAVKPQDMDSVVSALAGFLRGRTVIVSIAAGITTRFLEARCPGGTRVIRAMPNMPARAGEGMTGLSRGCSASSRDLALACRMFDCVGSTMVVEEPMLDALTAVSGSGPAYVFYIVECMLKAAQGLGFTQGQAQDLVYQTLLGSLCQMINLKEDPETLRAKVTSKGGTTEAALKVFEKAGTRKIFQEAFRAARTRSRELAR